MILKKNFLSNLLKFENKRIYYFIYFLTIFSCFLILIVLARRLAFLLFLFSLFIWFIHYFSNTKDKLLLRLFLIITIFSSVLILLKKFIFKGHRSINYVDMIQPRFNGIVNNITELFYLSGKDFYFGRLKGWGNIESGFINILLNTGIVGFMSYLFTFLFLIYFIYRNLNFLNLIQNKFYIFFSSITLIITNIVNNSFSTPYYFISFFIILLFCLSDNRKKII